MSEMNSTNEHLLSVRDLRVEYVTKDEVVKAVNGVSFDIDHGEALGLVGETGAGKTTIARSILGILPVPPAEVRGGEVYFEGRSILNADEKVMKDIRGKRISMVFQDPMTALNPVKRIGWQIAESIWLHEGVGWKEANERAMEMLEMVGISRDRFREYPHQFSGGMKQRVVIAIALACNPDLLIADEPTSALDVTIQAQVLDLIQNLQQEKNAAMIMITHDFGIIAETCDKVGVVYAGEIIEYGTVHQVLKNPKHPYTKGLFEAIPRISLDLDRLSPIKGLPPDPTNLPVGCKFAPRCPYVTESCISGEIETRTVEEGHTVKCNHEFE